MSEDTLHDSYGTICISLNCGNSLSFVSPFTENKFSLPAANNFAQYLQNLPLIGIPGVLGFFRDSIPSDAIANISQTIIPPSLLPPCTFMATLSDQDQITAYRACLLVYVASRAKIVPRAGQIQAALCSIHGKDSIVIAPTGWGKTLCIVIPLLLFPGTISMTISPLKRLQMMQVKEFERWGIKTIAINEDTSHSKSVWDNVQNGGFSHLIVQPEQFQTSHQSNNTRLAETVELKSFRTRVKRIHVDEAHFILTAGVSRNGIPPFRPAWGTLNEVRSRLFPNIPCQALSATLPPSILHTVRLKLSLSHDATVIQTSINRPNIVYCRHPLVNSIKDMRNLDFLIPTNLSPPMRLPKVILFFDNKVEATNAASYLNARLPSALQRLGICKHYHGDMSEEYLEQTYNDFINPDGICLILCATSGASTGLDARGINGVIQVGLCTEIADLYQRFGRGGRDEDSFSFAMLMFEPWALTLDLMSLAEDHRQEHSRPFSNFPTTHLYQKKSHTYTKQQRVTVGSLVLAQTEECLRGCIAHDLNDESETALAFSGIWCCSSPKHGSHACDPSIFFLGQMLTSENSSRPRKKRGRNTYRPMKQRDPLRELLLAFRTASHESMKPAEKFFQRPTSIIDEEELTILSRTLSAKICSADDITRILQRSQDWGDRWSDGLFDVISKYDHTLKHYPQGRSKVGTRMDETSDEDSNSDDSGNSG